MEKLVTTASPAGASGAANGGGSAVRQGGSTGGFQARMKLRAAIRAVAIVNRAHRFVHHRSRTRRGRRATASENPRGVLRSFWGSE